MQQHKMQELCDVVPYPALSILSQHHPFISILKSAYDEYQRIRHNQEKCLHLIKRTEKILVAIDSEIVKCGRID
jgi:hypothetical protein